MMIPITCTVNVTVNTVSVGEKSVMIQVFCNYSVISNVGVNLTINVYEAGSLNQIPTKSIFCINNSSKIVTFDDLQRNTAYASFATWNSPGCNLSTLVEFQTNNDQPASGNLRDAYYIQYEEKVMQQNTVEEFDLNWLFKRTSSSVFPFTFDV